MSLDSDSVIGQCQLSLDSDSVIGQCQLSLDSDTDSVIHSLHSDNAIAQ